VSDSPRDDQLCFYLNVHRDHDLAASCLRRLRRRYPAARVMVVSDGDDDPRYPLLARLHGAEYVRGERLYLLPCGGRLVQRMLDLFAEAPAEWLFKLDPDTRLHRRFRYAPSGCAVFGTLERVTAGFGEPLDPPNVQGGIVGLTRDAALRLRESGLLLSPELLDYRNTWACCTDMLRRAEGGFVSFDFVLRYACIRLGIPLLEYAEVHSVWRGGVRNRGRRFAATHPHKRLPLWERWLLTAQLLRRRVGAALG